MRSAKSIHHKHIAQGRVFSRRGLQILLLANIEATVFQQHDFACGNIKTTIDPITQQTYGLPKLRLKYRGHRSQ